MRGRIPEEKILEIRERIDIVEVVSSYLPLKRSGGNHQGLCPFHGEKTPSFNVNAPRQIFHCFGCGVGGNVFSFLMRMEGLSFPDAVRRLGERVGIEIEEEELSPAEKSRREEAAKLYKINGAACEFYHRILLEDPEGAPARAYLRARGYDGEAAREFRLGFAPPRWEALAGHLAEKGFDPDLVRKLGLIRSREEGRGDYDLFRNRLLFPILNLGGETVAFGGRVLDDSLPKYINSPESPVYHKGRLLYGLYQGRESMRTGGEAIVVEGYFDQMALHRAGFANAVASCGTALTRDHARLLKRYAKRILLLFDQDAAGRKATFRAMDELLAEGLSVAVVALDAGEDPDSFIAQKGVEAFRERLLAARPVLEVFMDAVWERSDGSIEGSARAVEEILEKLRLIPSEIERNLYLGALSGRSGLEQALLQQKMKGGRPAERRPSGQRRSEQRSPEQRSPGPPQFEPPAFEPPSFEPPPFEPSQFEPPQFEPPQFEPPPFEPPPFESPTFENHPAGQRQARAAAPRRQKGPEVKTQEWLLHMMVADDAVRRRVADEGAESLFLGEDYRVVAEEILGFTGEEGDLSAKLLDRPLSEGQKAILSGIVIKDDEAFAEDPESIFEGCHKAVARERLKMRSRELQELIRDAEQRRESGEAAGYYAEITEINRRLKTGTF